MPFGSTTAGMRSHPLWKTIRRDHKIGATSAGASRDIAQRLWSRLYSGRVRRLNEPDSVQSIATPFPGLSPVLHDVVASENFAFDRFNAIQSSKFPILRHTMAATESSHRCASWNWTKIEQHSFETLSYEQHHVPTTNYLTGRTTVHPRTAAALRSAFTRIHRHWSGTEAPTYPDAAIQLALSALSSTPSNKLIPVLFELEEYACYCALILDFATIPNSHSNSNTQTVSNWTETSFLDFDAIRASEKCVPEKVLNELEKLVNSQTIPLLINEFHCVADGNHRLAASWVWNALHFAKEEVWNTENIAFENALIEFVKAHETPNSALAAENALESLSSILTCSKSREKLHSIRNEIASHMVAQLPIVPILSYSGLALDRIAYEATGQLLRFNPKHYQTLQDDPLTCLPIKACYHFADHLPLPVFNVLSKSNNITRIHA